MEELQVIETTSGRQFKPWASREDVQAIGQAVEQAVQDPTSVTAIASEIASGKQAIAAAINAKGGSASATESFSELAQDIQDTPTSGVLSRGIVQSEPFSFLDYVCHQGAYPFTEIDDDSVTVINRISAFQSQTQLLKVRMSALITISGNYAFTACSALQEVDMPNLVTISGGSAFQNCSALQEVDMPNLNAVSVDYVFQNCTALQEINMPNLVTLSGSRVFQNCTALQEVNMPNLVNIGNAVFDVCTALRNVIFGTLTTANSIFWVHTTLSNLRNITIGQDTNINLDFHNWTATYVIAEGGGIDELNANLQTNLISKLYQGGGKILRLGAALYDVTTQETRDMVTAKGWTLQRG